MVRVSREEQRDRQQPPRVTEGQVLVAKDARLRVATMRRWGRTCGVLAVAASCALGCSKSTPSSQTGLMIIVSTNMGPSEYDSIRVEVNQGLGAGSGNWDKLEDDNKTVPAEVLLPATVFVRSGQAPDQDVLVQVTAYLMGQPVVLREAQLQIPTDHLAELRLVLAESCKGQVGVVGDGGTPVSTCPRGQSCQPDTGSCGDRAIPPGTVLSTYVPGDEKLDAGLAVTGAGASASGGSGSGDGGGCTSTCTQGQTTCVAAGLETCTLGTNGCWGYGAAAPCGSHQACTGIAGSSACTCNTDPVCSAVGSVCANSSTLASCAQDAQGCFYESASSVCTNGACNAGTNACTSGVTACAPACGTGLVCERLGGASCVDPNWAEWPMVDSPSYTDNGDGTVTDNGTGLVWQQAVPTTTYAQTAGLAYCAGLSLGGYKDWRLPSYVELFSIVDPSTVNPSINRTVFPGTPASYFWSSTPYAGASGSASTVDFTNGYTYNFVVSDADHVRCVR